MIYDCYRNSTTKYLEKLKTEKEVEDLIDKYNEIEIMKDSATKIIELFVV